MARPQNKFPIPSLRLKDGCWRIRWRDEHDRYEFSTGYREDKKADAESACLQVALALRNAAEWPDWADNIPAVQRWHAKEAITGAQGTINSVSALEAWGHHYKSSASPRQLHDRLYHLQTLSTHFDLLSLSADQASSFMQLISSATMPNRMAHRIAHALDGKTLTETEIFALMSESCTINQLRISLRNRSVFERIPEKGKKYGGKFKAKTQEKGLSPHTRSVYLQSFNMFYRWAVKQKLVKVNPFDGIKPARVEHHTEIVWLTRDERDTITRTVESSPGRLAVWIALYAGLREGEIARLQWADIDLHKRWIHVKKSKTGKSRRVPISESLLCALDYAPKKSGFVCPHWQDGDYHVKANSDLLPIRKSLPHVADKLKWNIFRHTFASLLAQTGKVSIDQISALMGNTPDVCRRHYAHLIPDAAERTGIDLID